MSNHYPDRPKRVLGIVVGGHDGDPDPQQTSNMRIMMPTLHGPDVNTEDMAFSPMSNAPTNSGQQSFMGALDPGSLVYVSKTLGENGGIIEGLANDLFGDNQGGGAGGGGGGKDLLQGEQYQKAINTELNVLVPPEVKEKDQADGVRVKMPKEKGKKHKHALTQGLPTHIATFQMSGYRMPQVKKVPTAKQAYQEIMNNDMLSQLPGMIGSLSGMMKGLMGGMGGSKGGGGGGAGGGGGSGINPGGQTAQTAGGNSSSSFSVSYFDPNKTTLTDVNQVTDKKTANAAGVNVTTTTTTATIKETIEQVDESHYDIHDPTSYKFGRSYNRYLAVHGANRGKLLTRKNIDSTSVETSDVYSDTVVNEANSYYKTTTTTEKTIKTANTVTENFTGTYKDYYGANSNITRMDIIYDNVEPQVARALDNLSVLLQGDAHDTSASITHNRVHEETWLDHATDLLSQCKNVTDIMSCLHRMVSDETLFGQDKIENVIVEVTTAWGNANTVLCANGDMFTIYSANQLAEMSNTQNNMLSWEHSPSGTGMTANTGNAKAMYANTKASKSGSSGGSGAGNGGGGGKGGNNNMMSMLGQLGNMFGKSAPIMQDMMKRMHQEHEQDAKKLHKKVNQSDDARNMWKHVEKTHEGGNPVAYDLFKS